jgi:hypothetical protein
MKQKRANVERFARHFRPRQGAWQTPGYEWRINL